MGNRNKTLSVIAFAAIETVVLMYINTRVDFRQQMSKFEERLHNTLSRVGLVMTSFGPDIMIVDRHYQWKREFRVERYKTGCIAIEESGWNITGKNRTQVIDKKVRFNCK